MMRPFLAAAFISCGIAGAWAQEPDAAAGVETPAVAAEDASDLAAAEEDIAFEDMTPEQQEAAYRTFVADLMAQMNPVSGAVKLVGAPVSLSVPDTYRFYPAADARRILEELWGNPPDDTVLGMVFPANADMAGDNWGVVLTYEDTGYVSDKDAQKIDFDDLLKDMQAGTEANNSARTEAGYGTIDLVGWAVAPSYDAANHRLYWAKDLLFSDAEGAHTLNYDMRLLGRSGVLSMNFVAGMDQISEIKAAGPSVLKMAAFDPGQTYADFQKGDKTAGYGIAALIAGGTGAAIAKKAGVFAIALAFLKKFGVIVFAGLAAVVGGFFRSLFGRKTPPADSGDDRPQE